MWHKVIWKGHPMRLELTRIGLLAELANHYTTRGACCNGEYQCDKIILHAYLFMRDFFLSSPVRLNGQLMIRVYTEHYNCSRWASHTNSFQTLEPLWSSDWNHPMRNVVSDWLQVQLLSITLINPLCFSTLLTTQDFNWLLHYMSAIDKYQLCNSPDFLEPRHN